MMRRIPAALAIGLAFGQLASGFNTTSVTDQVGIWPNGNIQYQIRLGGTASGTLLDGSTSWTTVVQDAFDEWNQHINNVQFTGVEAAVGGEAEDDNINDLFFSATIFGDSFGDSTLAVTLNRFQGFNNPLPRVEADIVFNNKSDLNWNSYRGERRTDIDDLRRVLIHELGHALGLDHPDDIGQTVDAVMNAFVSDVDTAIADDILGAQSLYGVGQAGVPDGGSGGGGGSTGDDFEDDDSSSSPSSISNGQTQSRSIHDIGDKDWVSFTVGGSGATNVVIETGGSSGDTEIFLFGPDSANTLITSNDDGGENFFSRINLSSLATGTYLVRVEEFSNNATISAYTLKVEWTESSGGGGGSGGGGSSSAKLSNLSVRSNTGDPFGTLILGFATSGANKEILMRGIGPTLGDFGVAGAIPDPLIRLFNSGQAQIALSDNWVDAANATTITSRGQTLGAFAPTSDLEGILLGTVTPGAYTVLATDVQDRTGNVLIEAYDADAFSATGRLVNLSTRTEVGGSAGTLIAGFVIAGTGDMTLLIRGVGPTLSDFGVSGALSDPTIRVLNSDQQEVGANDDWNSSDAAAKRSAAATVGAFALPEGSLDAALLISLSPGAYTVFLDGFGNAAGNALIEIYEVQ